MLDNDRELFEAWAKSSQGYVQEALDAHWQNGEYSNSEFEKRWEAWQAASTWFKKAVVVLEKGSKAKSGDILYKKFNSKYGYSENVFFAQVNPDLPEDDNVTIIQRGGKPVVYK